MDIYQWLIVCMGVRLQMLHCTDLKMIDVPHVQYKMNTEHIPAHLVSVV